MTPDFARENLAPMSSERLEELRRHIEGAQVALSEITRGAADAASHVEYVNATLARYERMVDETLIERGN